MQFTKIEHARKRMSPSSANRIPGHSASIVDAEALAAELRATVQGETNARRTRGACMQLEDYALIGDTHTAALIKGLKR